MSACHGQPLVRNFATTNTATFPNNRQGWAGTQVKVWLGDNQDHYYVLSRFLISRMLTVTKVPVNKVGLPHCQSGVELTYLMAAQLWSDTCAEALAPLQAVKISLEVKKYLVDNNHLDISQVYPFSDAC